MGCPHVPQGSGRSAGLVHKSTGRLAGGFTMNPTSLFTVALGLQAPWGVADVAFDRPAGRIDFQVAFTPGARFACPHCGAEHQPVHDTQEREWRHLNFFQFEAYIHAKVPRVRCESLRQDDPDRGALGPRQQRLHPVDGGPDRDPVPSDAHPPGGTVAWRRRHAPVAHPGLLRRGCPRPRGLLRGRRRWPGRDRRAARAPLHQPVPRPRRRASAVRLRGPQGRGRGAVRRRPRSPRRLCRKRPQRLHRYVHQLPLRHRRAPALGG